MTSNQLRKLHNLSLNCNTQSELNAYCQDLGLPQTKVAGRCTIIPMYYFKASKATGMKQNRFGGWYSPVIDLNRLNCSNYYVYHSVSQEHWYAQNGLRSLYVYSKIGDKSFRELCTELNEIGETSLFDYRTNSTIYLTLI